MDSTSPAPVVAPLSGEQRADVMPMPDEQRDRLEFLAIHALEEFSGKGWVAKHRERNAIVSVRTDKTLLTVNPNFGPTGAGILLDYVAALPPEVTLATIAYVKQLEARVERLTSSTVAQQVYTATTDRYVAQIEDLCQKLAVAQDEIAQYEKLTDEVGQSLALAREEAAEAERRAGKPVNTMSAAWCAARLLPIRHYLNNVQAKDPERFEWRAWLIELLNQVDNPPAAPVQSGEKEGGRDASKPCTCGFLAQTVGDGCWKCNPECHENDEHAADAAPLEGEAAAPVLSAYQLAAFGYEESDSAAGALLERREEGRADG